VLQHPDSCNPTRTIVGFLRESIHRILTSLLRAKQILKKKKSVYNDKYYEFSLLHIFSFGYSTLNVSIYSENRRGRYVLFRSPSFGPQKTITTWLTKTEIFTLHSINIIIRNNKCIFTKLNAVKLKTVV
jgi:hypothetical protein